MNDSQQVMKTPSRGSPAKRRHGVRVLTRRGEFLQTFRSGRRIKPCDWMIFNFAEAEEFHCGWTLPKAVGTAVVRNRLRRWTREWIGAQARRESALPPVYLNIGFRAGKPPLSQLKRAEFDQAMERGWQRLMTVTAPRAK